MPISQELLDQAEQMAKAAKPITRIAEILGVDYYEILDYLYSIGAYSWRGAKGIVTRRLQSLVAESNQTRRQQLADEAQHMVGYLYDQGTSQAQTLDKVKKALE